MPTLAPVPLRIRLLGPVDVLIDGTARPLSGLRRKSVLAVLGLNPGRVVSTDRIVDIVWSERPPATVANSLQNTVSYLRSALAGRADIVASRPGYRLDATVEETDAGQAEQLIRQDDDGTDPAATAARLRSALSLFRGHALLDVAGAPWLDEQAARLDRLRLDGVQALAEARLALGEHAQLVPELEQLAVEHPFLENLHRLLMLALYRCGREAEALAAYQRLRGSVVDELGTDPAPDLRDLHAAILRRDETIRQPPRQPPITAADEVTVRPAPAQLPLATRAFTGRADELARLDILLDDAGEAGLPTPIMAVSGTAGVGKTTLAVHWAHRIAPKFPDGQLYVNLRGYDPGAAPMAPAEAISRFLVALGVDARQIPQSPDEQSALYRTVLASRRLLIVLDNARDESQVRPLLPGSPGCLALITSRSRLGGLVVTDGARVLPLLLPSVDEARDLLRQRLGGQRVDAEPAAVNDIIARCARLPLALAVAAAHPAAEAPRPLAELADELRVTASALDPFHGPDEATDVRSVFSWSTHRLTGPAAQLFRLLGLCPGPDVSLAAVASLAGRPASGVRPILAELVHQHLLTEPAPGRYTFHDLLRAYAIEQADADENDEQRAAALLRLLDHYLHSAVSAMHLLQHRRYPIPLAAPLAGVTVTTVTGMTEAMAWFDAELPNLVAAVRLNRVPGGWRPWQLAWALDIFLERRSRLQVLAEVQESALYAAVRGDDTLGQAHAHLSLGRVCVLIGQTDLALIHHELADEHFAALGDLVGRARAADLATMATSDDDPLGSLRNSERALRLHRAAGDRRGTAYALNNVGWSHSLLGDFERGLRYGEQALALHVEFDDRRGQAVTLDSLGLAHFRLGRPQEGIAHFRQAIAVFHDLGDRSDEADSLGRLGDHLAAAGQSAAARLAWQRAASILDTLEHADAAVVHAKLVSVATPAGGA